MGDGGGITEGDPFRIALGHYKLGASTARH